MKKMSDLKAFVSIEKLIRKEDDRKYSECLSMRFMKGASVLPKDDFVGFKMTVPKKGRVSMELFGTNAVCEEDLEWMAEKVGKTSSKRKLKEKDLSLKELYEIVLPIAVSSAESKVGFRVAETEASAEFFSGWPSGYSMQFKELLNALQSCGAVLQYTAAATEEGERIKARKNYYKTFNVAKYTPDVYFGTPLKVRFLMLLPKTLSVRLKAVLTEAFPETECRYIGNIEIPAVKENWDNPMKDAVLLPLYAACFLFPEPALGETVPGVETYDEPVPDIPASHEFIKSGRSVVIGKTTDTAGKKRDVAIADLDLCRHYEIVGQTGTGKSTLLANVILNAVSQGYGLTFFDPHGSTIDVVLKSLPEEYADRVRVVRIGDAENPVPMCLWDSDNPEDAEKTISDLCELFTDIFDPKREGYLGPRWERWFSVFTKASIALLGRRASFESLEILSANRENMKKLYGQIVNKYPEIANQVKNEYGMDESRDFTEFLSWALCKMQRLTSVEQLRNTLGSGADAISFQSTIDTDAVTLIDLASPVIGTRAARTIGTILMMKLWNAVLARKDRKKTHIVVVDEASLFQTNPLPRMLAESRKFGLSMILCHQHMGQMKPEILEALEANSANLSAFRLSAKDAAQVAFRFDEDGMMEKLARLNAFRAITSVSVKGQQSSPFTLRIQPPKQQKAGEDIKYHVEQNSIKTLVKPYENQRAFTKDEIEQILNGKKIADKKSSGVHDNEAEIIFPDFSDDGSDGQNGSNRIRNRNPFEPEWLKAWNKKYEEKHKGA